MSYSDLRADWRDFSEKEMRSLPPTFKSGNYHQSKYYFTGKPCSKGHVTVRYSASSSCVMCQAKREKARKKKPVSTFVRKKAMKSVIVMGIKMNRPLSNRAE